MSEDEKLRELERLIDAFLNAIDHLSLREAEQVTGISYGTIQKWKQGHWTWMQPATQRKVEAYLARRKGDLNPGNRAFALIGALEHPQGLRRFEGKPSEFTDPIAVAFEEARADGFGAEEWEALFEWALGRVKALENRYQELRRRAPPGEPAEGEDGGS